MHTVMGECPMDAQNNESNRRFMLHDEMIALEEKAYHLVQQCLSTHSLKEVNRLCTEIQAAQARINQILVEVRKVD